METPHKWLVNIHYPIIPYCDQNLKPFLKAEVHKTFLDNHFRLAFPNVDAVYESDMLIPRSKVMHILAELNNGQVVSEYKKNNPAYKLAIKYYQISGTHTLVPSDDSNE